MAVRPEQVSRLVWAWAEASAAARRWDFAAENRATARAESIQLACSQEEVLAAARLADGDDCWPEGYWTNGEGAALLRAARANDAAQAAGEQP